MNGETTAQQIKRLEDFGNEWHKQYWDLKNSLQEREERERQQIAIIKKLNEEITNLKNIIKLKGYFD